MHLNIFRHMQCRGHHPTSSQASTEPLPSPPNCQCGNSPATTVPMKQLMDAPDASWGRAHDKHAFCCKAGAVLIRGGTSQPWKLLVSAHSDSTRTILVLHASVCWFAKPRMKGSLHASRAVLQCTFTRYDAQHIQALPAHWMSIIHMP